jgi:hypothetical protein
MDQLLTRVDAIQAHMEIAYQINILDLTPMQLNGFGAANKAIASIFCDEYAGVCDLHLRKNHQ